MLKTPIPFIDLRGRTTVDLLRAYPDTARQIIASAKGTYGLASRALSALLLPLADRRSHDWLARMQNPFLHEIETMADIVNARGVYALNLSDQWACTSGAYRTGETVSLLRTLDWPLPDLGRHAVVALQLGEAGEFYNVTWPGLSGVFTAMAPGRFAAAINQAPMRRHGRTLIGDWLENRKEVQAATGLPPSHLLRRVCEEAADYHVAKETLTSARLAGPAIFILTGTKPGQGCIIERVEDAADVIELVATPCATAANHFNGAFAAQGKGWRARPIDSQGRYKQSVAIAGYDLERPDFNWLKAPAINAWTRLCVLAEASAPRLLVQGFEGALPVTDVFQLPHIQGKRSAWN